MVSPISEATKRAENAASHAVNGAGFCHAMYAGSVMSTSRAFWYSTMKKTVIATDAPKSSETS